MNTNEPIKPDQPVSGDPPGPCELQGPETEAAERAAVAEHLAGWRPVQARCLDPRILARIEPSVRSAVAAAAPNTVSDVRRMLRASFGINIWTQDELGFLDVETVWHPERARVFVDEVNGDRSVDWRQETRWTLTQIGRRVNPRFWPAPTEPLTKTGPAAAYTETEEAALRHAALLIGGPGRAAELAVAGLSLGAGLDAPRIRLASPTDVIDLGSGRLGTQVRGPHGRVVPIRANCTDLVLRAVEFAGDGRFIRAASRNGVYIAAERVIVHGFGRLELARARSTWLRAHLVAGTPLAALRVIAGPLSLNTLNDLLAPASEAFSAEAAAVEGLRA